MTKVNFEKTLLLAMGQKDRLQAALDWIEEYSSYERQAACAHTRIHNIFEPIIRMLRLDGETRSYTSNETKDLINGLEKGDFQVLSAHNIDSAKTDNHTFGDEYTISFVLLIPDSRGNPVHYKLNIDMMFVNDIEYATHVLQGSSLLCNNKPLPDDPYAINDLVNDQLSDDIWYFADGMHDFITPSFENLEIPAIIHSIASNIGDINESLLTAAQNNTPMQLTEIIKHGANINAHNDEQENALWLSIINNPESDHSVINLLIQNNIDVNHKNKDDLNIIEFILSNKQLFVTNPISFCEKIHCLLDCSDILVRDKTIDAANEVELPTEWKEALIAHLEQKQLLQRTNQNTSSHNNQNENFAL